MARKRRLETLHERKAGGLLRFDRLGVITVTHAAEADDRLVGALEQVLQLFDAIPGAGLVRQHRGPGDHVHVRIARHHIANAGGVLEPHRDAKIKRVFRLDAFLHERHQILERLLGVIRHRPSLPARHSRRADRPCRLRS